MIQCFKMNVFDGVSGVTIERPFHRDGRGAGSDLKLGEIAVRGEEAWAAIHGSAMEARRVRSPLTAFHASCSDTIERRDVPAGTTPVDAIVARA